MKKSILTFAMSLLAVFGVSQAKAQYITRAMFPSTDMASEITQQLDIELNLSESQFDQVFYFYLDWVNDVLDEMEFYGQFPMTEVQYDNFVDHGFQFFIDDDNTFLARKNFFRTILTRRQYYRWLALEDNNRGGNTVVYVYPYGFPRLVHYDRHVHVHYIFSRPPRPHYHRHDYHPHQRPHDRPHHNTGRPHHDNHHDGRPNVGGGHDDHKRPDGDTNRGSFGNSGHDRNDRGDKGKIDNGHNNNGNSGKVDNGRGDSRPKGDNNRPSVKPQKHGTTTTTTTSKGRKPSTVTSGKSSRKGSVGSSSSSSRNDKKASSGTSSKKKSSVSSSSSKKSSTKSSSSKSSSSSRKGSGSTDHGKR